MHRCIRALLLMLAVSLSQGATARAAAVFSGCAEPPLISTGRAFYIDPVHGSPRGNGSRERPWRTLAEVVDAGLFATMPAHYDNWLRKSVGANPSAPVKPGDTVYLLSGDHGSVLIQGDLGKGLVGYNNPQFITIAALPGQTPIIEQLTIKGAANWVFKGITFQSLNNSGAYWSVYSRAKDYFLVSLSGEHSNIVLLNNTLQSQPDTSAWTIKDWEEKRVSGILDESGKCISIVGNTIRNIGFGMGTQRSNQVLIKDNLIDRFADDGIDYGSSNLLIEGNRITNAVEDADGNHRDGMQGQPYTMSSTVANVTIRNNTVIRVTDPTLPYPAQLQGIDEFDGVWDNVTVVGNVVIVDTTNGIAYYGVHHALISKNIVLPDSGKVLPCAVVRLEECMTTGVVYNTSALAIPALRVVAAKDKSPSEDVTVTGNVASGLGVQAETVLPVVVTGNVCVSKNGKCTLALPIDGKEVWFGKPGTYPGDNSITDADAERVFATYDTVNMKYDLKLRSDSQ